MLVDTHCHLDFERFDEDRDQVIARALVAGVKRIIVPALDLKNCPAVLRLAEQHAAVFAAVGVHPNSTADWQADWIDAIRDFARHNKVVAIGEIGLDYYWDRSPKTVQQQALSSQLDLAAELELPVIIHNRESSHDVIRLLTKSPLNGRDNPGVLHSFLADWQTASAALDLGFYLGFTGPVTFKKAEGLRDIARRIPINRLLIETDAPFLAPEPRRGKRNEPSYVAFIAERIAALRDMNPDVFAEQTTHNAARLFGTKLVEDLTAYL
ncbi:MAG: TatD family hydrolase [Candidatus Promineifilaceae bacterium]|nr:TatD family hydrolase [Candidatus Promineifilaceae bacterium]